MQTGHAGFDRFFSGPGAFVTGGTILPAWSPDGGALAFLEGAAEQRTGRLVDLATGEQRPLLADVGALREAIREAIREATGADAAGLRVAVRAPRFRRPAHSGHGGRRGAGTHRCGQRRGGVSRQPCKPEVYQDRLAFGWVGKDTE